MQICIKVGGPKAGKKKGTKKSALKPGHSLRKGMAFREAHLEGGDTIDSAHCHGMM